MRSAGPRLDAVAARDALAQLLQLERELVELEQVRRVDGLERVREAIRRIGDVGSPEGILDRAAEDLGTSAEFDRVLISRVRDARVVPHSIWIRDDPEAAEATLERLAPAAFRLEYPLIEEEVARRQRAATVDVGSSGARSPRGLAEALGWGSYVVDALTLRGSTVGLVHADAEASGRAVDDLDRDLVAVYAEGLAGAFERAALRRTLQRHREELRSAVEWIGGRLRESQTDPAPGWRAGARDPDPGVASLTAREVDVLQQLVGGRTNRSIAKALVISEGTVKYHVKNILRKLGASSRSDAVARYLRSRA